MRACRLLFIAATGLASEAVLHSQTVINGSRVITGAWDASNAASTKPAKAGASLPGNCSEGEAYFRTGAPAGQNLYVCSSPNTWTLISGGGAATDHQTLLNIGTNTHAQIDSHLANQSNPHSVTKAQIGLGNVTNDAQVKGAASLVTAGALPMVAASGTLAESACEIDASNTLTCPGGFRAGDGTAAGEVVMNELSANGNDSFSWLAPDAITTSVRYRFPDALPGANNFMLFGAPAAGISTFAWLGLAAAGGLTVSGGLGLTPCAVDGQVPKWTAAGGWACAVDQTGGGGSTPDLLISMSFDGGGAVLAAGSKGYKRVFSACTVAEWSVVASPSGSLSVDVYRIADNTSTLPTASIVGAGNKPSLTTAVAGRAAPSGWTSTAIAANDLLAFSIDAATTVSWAEVSLRCTR